MEEKSNKGFRKLALLVVVLLAFFVSLTCFYQTRNTQAAVLTTFEKPVKTIDKAGLHFKLPWPIQKAYVFDLRTKLYQSPFLEYLVKDGFNVVVRTFATWSIDNVDTYKNRVGVTEAKGQEIVADLVSKHLKIVLSENRFADMIGIDDKGGSKLAVVENILLDRVRKEALEKYGMQVSCVGFDRLELPENVTRAVIQRMKSERARMVEEIRSQSQAKASEIRRQADSERNQIISQAQTEASKIRGQADTEAFKHLDVYRKQPEFALFLKKLEALEKTMKTKTTIVIDKNTPPFNMLSPSGALLEHKPVKEEKKDK